MDQNVSKFYFYQKLNIINFEPKVIKFDNHFSTKSEKFKLKF